MKKFFSPGISVIAVIKSRRDYSHPAVVENIIPRLRVAKRRVAVLHRRIVTLPNVV